MLPVDNTSTLLYSIYMKFAVSLFCHFPDKQVVNKLNYPEE